jgi:hypothetical protein
MSNQQPYAFVGDLHGRTKLLDFILSRDRSERYHYVFVGDILHHKHHFRNTKRTSPIQILKTVNNLVRQGRATLIAGNNENYILNHLILPESDVKKKEAKYTLRCLRQLDLDERLQYISLLSNSPTHLELDGYYRLAHAYYSPNDRQKCLYGPGYAWFKDDQLSAHNITNTCQYFFGHYGLPYSRENIRILDATNLEAVGVYYSDREEFMLYY